MCPGFGKWKRRDPIWADSPLGQCCRNPPEWHNSKSECSRLGRYSYLGIHPRENERKMSENISSFCLTIYQISGHRLIEIFQNETSVFIFRIFARNRKISRIKMWWRFSINTMVYHAKWDSSGGYQNMINSKRFIIYESSFYLQLRFWFFKRPIKIRHLAFRKNLWLVFRSPFVARNLSKE